MAAKTIISKTEPSEAFRNLVIEHQVDLSLPVPFVPALRYNLKIIVAVPGDNAGTCARRIAARLSKDVSGGATITPVEGLWVAGCEHDDLSGPIEVATAFRIDVSILPNNFDTLLCCIRKSFAIERDRFGLCANWIHMELSYSYAFHFSLNEIASPADVICTRECP